MPSERHITYMFLSPKMHNLNLIMRKHEINPNCETLCKISNEYSSKVSKHERQGETEKAWHIGRDYGDVT